MTDVASFRKPREAARRLRPSERLFLTLTAGTAALVVVLVLLSVARGEVVVLFTGPPEYDGARLIVNDKPVANLRRVGSSGTSHQVGTVADFMLKPGEHELRVVKAGLPEIRGTFRCEPKEECYAFIRCEAPGECRVGPNK